MLAAALAAGAALRFAGLGAREMSADEGASWAAASAATASEVLRLQAQLNAGKLALHDLALHAWINAFGDGVASMRAMSAALGTVAIALVYLVSRELLLWSQVSPEDDGGGHAEAAWVASLSALLFAVSTVPINYSRELRMYPVLLAATLTQVWFVLRAARVGGIKNYAGVTVFTALAVSAHFSALCVLASEGLWLLYLLASERGANAAVGSSETVRPTQRGRIAQREVVWKLAASIALGFALMAPVMWGALRAGAAAVGGGVLKWIRPPTPWDAVTIFKSGAGNFVLPIVGAVGAVLGWRWARGAVVFALVWMWVPVLLLLFASYMLTPILVERYLLSSFVPLFILVALAAGSLNTRGARWAGLALVTILAVGQDVRYFRHRHNDAQWREAAAIASAIVTPGQSIGVVPGYAVNVVRYYTAHEKRSEVVAALDHPPGAAPSVVIVFDQGLSSDEAAALRAAYPNPVARLQRLVVASR